MGIIVGSREKPCEAPGPHFHRVRSDACGRGLGEKNKDAHPEHNMGGQQGHLEPGMLGAIRPLPAF